MLTIALWRAGGIAVSVLLGTIVLHILARRFVQHHPHPSHAVARWLHGHVALALVAGGLMVLVVFATLARGLGARFNHVLHIRPAPAQVQAGSAAPPSFSLAPYLPNPAYSQGQSQACGAFAVATVLYTERRERHEQLGADAWSPFFDYAYAAGGQDAPTTLDQEAEAFGGHGTVPWGSQPALGWPTQDVISQALGLGVSYGYLFYSPAGEAGLTVIRGAIAQGHPVVLLIAIHNDFWNAFGVTQTDNGGAFSGFYHFVVAYAYQGDQFWIRNSWGTDFGQNGHIILTHKAMLNTVLAAGVVLPGPVAWPLPRPEPQPTRVPPAPLPTPPPLPPPAPPTPQPPPTPSPRPGAVLVPLARLPATIIVVTPQYLRRTPRTAAARDTEVQRGTVLRTRGPQTPHWIEVQMLKTQQHGWIARHNARALA